MADLFHNAMSFIDRESPSQNDSPLIGTIIQVGKIRLVIRRKIGTGGFADVFAAQDDAGQWFAVKRQMVIDAESIELALNEIRTAQKLSGPPSIVKFVEGAKKSPPEGSRGATEFLMVSELCSGGVIDLLKKNDLEHDQILRIAQACADAIHEMHERSPSITHRDIKVENLLIGQDSQVKLCDFGSSTTDFYIPDYTMSTSERTWIEKLYQYHTTSMYRPPEILRTCNDYPIGPQMDIWAFGCVLFYLCYRVHPFEDSNKQQILMGGYMYPNDVADHKNACFNDIIDVCLKLDPSARPDSDGLVSLVENLGRQLNIKTRGPVAGTGSQDFLAGLSIQGGSSRASPSMRDSAVPPARPSPPATRVAEEPEAAEFDPFAGLMDSSFSYLPSEDGSTTNSGFTTPAPVSPNNSRVAFDFVGAAGTTKKPSSANTFGDLLSGHGFSSTGNNANQTIADMRRADEIRAMDPVSIKIRDWTKGKEKDIRALLASLNDVLWEGAARWNQPSMADLLHPDQIENLFCRACLVVHPDVQVGGPYQQLAEAIFCELNDGWTEFLSNPDPFAVQAERDTMNGQMKKENAELIDSLVQTVKKTESELEQTRKVLDRMRKEKIDQENEQEKLYNTLRKQIELLNNDKRRMERIIQTAYEKGFVETEVTTPPTMASSSSDPLFVVSPIPYMERPPSSVSPSNNELRTLRYNVRHLQSQVNEYQTMDDQKTSQIRHLQAALAAIAREKDDYVRQMEELNRSFNSRTDNYVAGLLKEDQPMGPPSVPHTPRGMHESVSDMDDASSRGSHRDDFMN